MQFLESVKKATFSVLSETSENELKLITLPVLREKVANAINVSIEEFMGKDIKMVIMEAFQDFLLKGNKTENSTEAEASESEEDTIKDRKTQVRTIKKPKKPKMDSNDEISKEKAQPTKSVQSGKSVQIEKLKSYVFKCGVRKIWKREFEGLNENQCIARLQEILKDLGIEGKPSLEQCREIKAKREFEAEMKEIDTSNIIEGKRRRNSAALVPNKSIQISSSDEEEIDSSDSADSSDSDSSEVSEDTSSIDLKALGDSESD